jgi:hypothetical protein
MTVKLSDTATLGYDTYKKRVAAVGIWLVHSLQQGALPQKTWGDRQHEETIAYATGISLDSHQLDRDRHLMGIHSNFRWRLNNGDSWGTYFKSILATPVSPDTKRGKEAEDALSDANTATSRARLFTFSSSSKHPAEAILAAIVLVDALYLFDPKNGLYEVKLSDRPLFWFERHMTQHYGPAGQVSDWVSHLVEVTDLFYTWLGPPAAISDGVRPDLMGPVQMSRARFGRFKPRIKFCCLERYKDNLSQELSQGLPRGTEIEIFAIEDQLPEQIRGGKLLDSPDFKDLDACVATILYQMLNDTRLFSQTTGSGQGKPIYAFAKDIWSLFCLYKYGGYHLDTGVVPDTVPGTNAVEFPKCSTFSIVDIFGFIGTASGQRTAVPHKRGKFKKLGLDCVAIKEENNILVGQVLTKDLAKDQTSISTLSLHNQFDVFLMRSPRGHLGIKRALMFYIYIWFKTYPLVKQDKLNTLLYKSACRSAILSAVATGLTHSEKDGTGCTGATSLPENSLIIVGQEAKIQELGVRKFGFQSHS